MHGLINRSIQSFLTETYGEHTWRSVAEAAALVAAGANVHSCDTEHELMVGRCGLQLPARRLRRVRAPASRGVGPGWLLTRSFMLHQSGTSIASSVMQWSCSISGKVAMSVRWRSGGAKAGRRCSPRPSSSLEGQPPDLWSKVRPVRAMRAACSRARRRCSVDGAISGQRAAGVLQQPC